MGSINSFGIYAGQTSTSITPSNEIGWGYAAWGAEFEGGGRGWEYYLSLVQGYGDGVTTPTKVMW